MAIQDTQGYMPPGADTWKAPSGKEPSPITVETEKSEKQKMILDYAENTLADESEQSFISRAMNQECKVAVMIPVYNESPSTLLRSLSSLSKQEGADPHTFEVDIVVNNKKQDAENNSDAFRANQESLALIRYINVEQTEMPQGLSEAEQKQIQTIKESGITINAIDKSSSSTANEENNVGMARNRAGAEMAKRFVTSSGNTEGVIAITDSDCVFSSNYIKALTDSFAQHPLNGVSGNLEFEIDPELPNQELIQRAFNIYMGKDGPKQDYGNSPNFKLHAQGALQSGANMAVSARAFAEVGGMPPIAGGEDVRFGMNVEKLDGGVAKNYDYTTTSLIRVSERTGLQGNGRIVKKIKESIDAFVSGQSDKILIEDKNGVNRFFGSVIQASQENTLTPKHLVEFMAQNNFKSSDLSETTYTHLVDEINRELKKPENEQDLRKIERLALEQIYPLYPEIDVTHKLFPKE